MRDLAVSLSSSADTSPVVEVVYLHDFDVDGNGATSALLDRLDVPTHCASGTPLTLAQRVTLAVAAAEIDARAGR